MGNTMTELKTGSYAAAIAKAMTAFIDDEQVLDICYDQLDKEFYYGGRTMPSSDSETRELIWETSAGLGLWEPLPEHLDEIGEMSEPEKAEWIDSMADEIEQQHRGEYSYMSEGVHKDIPSGVR